VRQARVLLFVLVAAAVAACGSTKPAPPPPAQTGANTLVVPPIVYGKLANGIALTARDDGCDAPGTLRAAIGWKLEEPYLYLLDSDPGNIPGIQTLKIEIVDILANGGGVFSGPKMVAIKGTLSRGGTRISGFTAMRTSMPFFPPRTTCNIVGRSTEALGGDIAGWLLEPVDGAVIE
jgi:hypothetical protein